MHDKETNGHSKSSNNPSWYIQARTSGYKEASRMIGDGLALFAADLDILLVYLNKGGVAESTQFSFAQTQWRNNPSTGNIYHTLEWF